MREGGLKSQDGEGREMWEEEGLERIKGCRERGTIIKRDSRKGKGETEEKRKNTRSVPRMRRDKG